MNIKLTPRPSIKQLKDSQNLLYPIQIESSFHYPQVLSGLCLLCLTLFSACDYLESFSSDSTTSNQDQQSSQPPVTEQVSYKPGKLSTAALEQLNLELPTSKQSKGLLGI